MKLCVCVYTNNSIKINKNGKKLRGFNDDMSHLTGTPRIAKDTGRGIAGIYTRLWIKLHIKKVALLEQIREHSNTPALEDENDTMSWCITKVAKDLGLNTG